MNIKVLFVDFYVERDTEKIKNVLSKISHFIIDKNPQYVFYSDYGNEYLKYKNAIRIYFTGENLVPNFNLCDYAIGMHHIDFEDRYIRLPLFAIREPYKKLLNKNFDREAVLNRKFCNFVYSNAGNAHPIRNKFFHELSKYKKIDAGGKLFNNVGGPVENKIEFISNYKFTIAIENSSVNGYVTEKIVEPMSVNSIPIYWGSPTIDKDFNTKSFIIIEDDSEKAIKKAIEEIIFLDNNDEAYIQKLSEPWLFKEQYIGYEEKLKEFLTYIIEQPIEKAYRRALHGFNMRYEERLVKAFNNSPNNSLSISQHVKEIAKKIFSLKY